MDKCENLWKKHKQNGNILFKKNPKILFKKNLKSPNFILYSE